MTFKDLSRPRHTPLEARCQNVRGSSACRLNAGRFSMYSYTLRGPPESGQINVYWGQGCWTAGDKSATALAKLIGPARLAQDLPQHHRL